MAITATFNAPNNVIVWNGDPKANRNIAGYRISVATSSAGIQAFFVHLYEETPLDANRTHIQLPGGHPPVGTLVLNEAGNGRNYTFANIQLTSVELGITRNKKFRLTSFSYPNPIGAQTPIEASLKYPETPNINRHLAPLNALGDNYRYMLEMLKNIPAENKQLHNPAPQHLLGFSTFQSSTEYVVLRLTALRNTHNSFLNGMIALHNRAIQIGQAGGAEDFRVTLGTHPLNIQPANWYGALIHESHGKLLMSAEQEPSLIEVAKILALDNQNATPLTALRLKEFGQREFFAEENKPSQFGVVDTTIETTTLVLHPQQYHNISLA